MNENEVIDKLREMFSLPEYAFMPQVRNGVGFSRAVNRTADAIAMGLWPSRGLSLHGFEVKCSKADLKSELNNPSKADAIGKYCNYWWLVVSDVKITDNLIIPTTWGIIECSKKVKVIKQAEELKPIPLDKQMVASILKKAMEHCVPESIIVKRIEVEKKNYFKEQKNELYRTLNRELEYYKDKYNKLNDIVVKFYDKTGIDLERIWDEDNLFKIIKIVYNAEQHGGIISFLRYLSHHAGKVADMSRTIMEEVHEIENSDIIKANHIAEAIQYRPRRTV